MSDADVLTLREVLDVVEHLYPPPPPSRGTASASSPATPTSRSGGCTSPSTPPSP